MWEKIKGVWLLSQENRKLRNDLMTVLQYVEVYRKDANQRSIPTEEWTKETG